MSQMIRGVAVAAILVLIGGMPAMGAESTQQAEVKTHRQKVTQTPGEYVVRMSGHVDGLNTRGPIGYRVFDQVFEPNVELSITNVGDEVVHNPWIRVDGRGGWRNVQEMVAKFAAGLKSDAEKARAAYEFERKHRHHCSTYDAEGRDVVKMMNAYGYTLCFDDSKCLAQLWEAAGLKTRRGWPYGHSVTEVFYDDAWHMMDGDEHCIYLLRDNRTIASEEQFVRDPDLIKRTHSYGPLFRDDRMADQGGAALFYYDGPRGGDWAQKCSHEMVFDLRPGEKIAWRWDNRGRYHGLADLQRWKGAIEKVCNGYMEYTPGSRGLAIDPSIRRYDEVTDDGKIWFTEIPVRSAWPIVGGWIDLAATGMSVGPLQFQIAKPGEEFHTVWRNQGGMADKPARVSLDEYFTSASAACYEYRVRLVQGPVTQRIAGADVVIHSTLQMAWLAMPALACGDNKVVYSDQSKSRSILIEHKWTERSDSAPPAAVAAGKFPKDGGTVRGTKFRFEWEAPAGPEKMADYWFELSDRPDMRWPLSSNFEKRVSYTKQNGTASYEVPCEGLLNPGQTYYWRVRARNAKEVWGPWSKVWSFTVQAPGVPMSPRLTWDRDSRRLTLTWEPNPQGEKPTQYVIYGSDEKGFTASDEPYRVHCGQEGQQTFPANRVAETAETSYVIPLVDEPMFVAAAGSQPAATQLAASQSARATVQAMNPGPVRMYYRVVAVDKEGVRSGPSDSAQVPGPIIYTATPKQIPAGEMTVFQMRAAASVGNLRSRAVEGKSYQAAFGLNADELTWSAHSDTHVSIEPKTGLVKLNPALWDCQTPTEIVILCRNQRGQEDAYRFTLTVTPPEAAKGAQARPTE